MFKKSKNKQKPKSNINTRKKNCINGVFEVTIGIAFVIVMMLVVSYVVKISGHVSKSIDAPKYQVRLQVINSCRDEKTVEKITRTLSRYRDRALEIKIMNIDNFDLKKVNKSFIISREEEKTAAEKLASTIGLDPGMVVYRPLENNYRQISATLVIGMDFDKIILPGEKTEET